MTENERAARKKKIMHAVMWVVLLLLFICFVSPFILVVINVFKTKADITTNPLAIVGKHGFTMKNFPEAMRASVLGNGSFHGHSVSGSDGTARLSIRRNARSPESQTYSYSDACRILGIYGAVHVPRSDSHEHTA